MVPNSTSNSSHQRVQPKTLPINFDTASCTATRAWTTDGDGKHATADVLLVLPHGSDTVAEEKVVGLVLELGYTRNIVHNTTKDCKDKDYTVL